MSVSGRTLATTFIIALSLSVTTTLGMLSFEDKRPTNIPSAQVKLSSCSKERKEKPTDYVRLVEVTPTISNNGIP